MSEKEATSSNVNCPCPPYPPFPPYPPYPPVPPVPPTPPTPPGPEPVEIQYKDIILTKKLNGILYELMVKTSTNNVYIDPDKKVTLTEKLGSIADDLLSLNEKSDTFENKFADLLRDAPETFNTFKEVWDYVNVNGDPESELIRMIKAKQDAEEGKGLSTHDLTDVLYEKLVNSYTNDELDALFDIVFKTEDEIKELVVKSIEALHKTIDDEIEELRKSTTSSIESIAEEITKIEEKPNVQVSEKEPAGLVDNTTWYQVISNDTSKQS